MHSIKNISERNKIDAQSRTDTYIRRKRLISKSDYNLKSGCTQKFLWNWKNPKNPLFWAKKPQKTKKKLKNPKKNQKKTPWPGFFFFKPGFFQPWNKDLEQYKKTWVQVQHVKHNCSQSTSVADPGNLSRIRIFPSLDLESRVKIITRSRIRIF